MVGVVIVVVLDLEREARVEPLSEGAGVIAPLTESADGVVGMEVAVSLRRGGMVVFEVESGWGGMRRVNVSGIGRWPIG